MFCSGRVGSLSFAGRRRGDALLLPRLLDTINSTIDPLLQANVDALTCEGIGGLAAQVFAGLLSSKTITIPDLSNYTSLKLPNQRFTIKSQGNTFVLDLKNRTAIVNGRPIIPFVVIITLHGKILHAKPKPNDY